MRISFRKAALALAAAGLLASALPANAANLTWTDPEGDAFPAGLNPGIDIVRTSLATTADSFVWKIQVKELGDPLPPGTGHHFTLGFTFGDASFTMRVKQDLVSGNGLVFEKQDETTPTVQSIGCAKCKLDFDAKTNTITLTATLGTMQAASRKLVAGAKIESVNVFSAPLWEIPEVGTLYLGSGQGDSAPPPGDATFTF